MYLDSNEKDMSIEKGKCCLNVVFIILKQKETTYMEIHSYYLSLDQNEIYDKQYHTFLCDSTMGHKIIL